MVLPFFLCPRGRSDRFFLHASGSVRIDGEKGGTFGGHIERQQKREEKGSERVPSLLAKEMPG